MLYGLNVTSVPQMSMLVHCVLDTHETLVVAPLPSIGE